MCVLTFLTSWKKLGNRRRLPVGASLVEIQAVPLQIHLSRKTQVRALLEACTIFLTDVHELIEELRLNSTGQHF